MIFHIYVFVAVLFLSRLITAKPLDIYMVTQSLFCTLLSMVAPKIVIPFVTCCLLAAILMREIVKMRDK